MTAGDVGRVLGHDPELVLALALESKPNLYPNMNPNLDLDPLVVSVVAAMVVVTVLTKVGGLWLLRRVEVSERVEAGLSVLPGAIVIAILGPELATAGPAEWTAAGVVLLVAWRTENILLALACGVAAVLAVRGLF